MGKFDQGFGALRLREEHAVAKRPMRAAAGARARGAHIGAPNDHAHAGSEGKPGIFTVKVYIRQKLVSHSLDRKINRQYRLCRPARASHFFFYYRFALRIRLAHMLRIGRERKHIVHQREPIL
jgi:hypothetical protein